MGKKKIVHICENCGFHAEKWVGKCPECNEWGTLKEKVEITVSNKKMPITSSNSYDEIVLSYDSIQEENNIRYTTSIEEFDRLLGGGLLRGEVALITGNPGIGKSTLLLQLTEEYSKYGLISYISGEESPAQIKNRGKRLGVSGKNLHILNITNILTIHDYILKERPKVIIIDSIQTLYNPDIESIPGTPTQIKECTLQIIELAKKHEFSFFLIGHITKDGKVAGPKLLEHMVDAVFNFEGEDGLFYRILRSSKNRFGSTNELAIFSMEGNGLKEIKNSSEYFLSEREEKNIGSMIVPVLEGTKVFLLEIQSLITESFVGIPKRVVNGFDRNRIQILIAIAEKKMGIQIMAKDLFVNIPGGINIVDPASDLGVLISILSAYKGIAVSQKIAAIGELGLRGEIRKVFFIDKRLKELEKLGFTGVYVPDANRKEIEKERYKLKLIYLKNIENILEGIK
ncbi:DNA repair protein RadA [Fusobacterium sp. PH5-44]|uniref:DNA repair protein RadA n=1 Tax=unclassified Fusobacterium TaxID=2648384 RepID=UPI003D1AA8C7